MGGWDNFGLQKNPFDIKAVEKFGIIPVSTFIGREQNRNDLKKIIQTRDHSLSLIVAEKGIGKTSLGNVVQADLADEYFITLSEIDSQSDWSSTDFVFQALGNIYETVCMVDTYEGLPVQYQNTCKKIKEELDSLFEARGSSFGLQGAGFGFDKGASRGLDSNAAAVIRLKMKTIVNILLQNNYKGLILQYNNLDNIEEEKKLSRVLADLRNYLLSNNCHFIFLGNKIMESCFKANSKVNDCISSDVQLGPLNYHEIKQILDKRYDSFKIPQRTPIAPITDDALATTYELYDGNIRQIFYSLDKAVINSERILGKTQQLDDTSTQKVLFALTKERIRSEIQPRAFDVLSYALKKKGEVTNTEITKKLKLRIQNTSKYLNQLKANNLVVAVGREGRNIHYKAVNEARWLLLSPDVKQTTL